MTIQKIENCLSGYYAAFGSYPPVTLHGSRNYNLEVNINGIQTDEEVNSGLDWPRVEAACRLATEAGYKPAWFNNGILGNEAWNN